MNALAWTAFGLGGLLCLTNFYLAFLRYPLHRLCGGTKETYRWISGFPIVGSALVVLSLLRLGSTHAVPAIALIAVDTGGIHWFAGTVLARTLRKK